MRKSKSLLKKCHAGETLHFQRYACSMTWSVCLLRYWERVSEERDREKEDEWERESMGIEFKRERGGEIDR